MRSLPASGLRSTKSLALIMCKAAKTEDVWFSWDYKVEGLGIDHYPVLDWCKGLHRVPRCKLRGHGADNYE
jgi:hypothetical protein